MTLSKDAIEHLLDGWPVARLASVGSDGRPHQVPIVFARVGDWLWSPIDGKPKASGDLQRLRNIRERPQVSLLLDDYSADWSRLWWIRADGTARIVQPSDPEGDPDIAAAVQALRRKYPQYAEVPVLRDPPTLLALRPTAIRSWCANPDAALAATRDALGS